MGGNATGSIPTSTPKVAEADAAAVDGRKGYQLSIKRR